MSVYEKDDGRLGPIVQRLLEKYHGELVSAGVTFELMFAHAKTNKNGDPVGPAIKHGGYAAAAVVRVISLKDRAKGLGDVEIVVDGDRWDEWPEDTQDSILDHELEHVDLVPGKEGEIKRDDLGRPCVRMRLHDRQFGWFDVIAHRHGAASVEVRQAASIAAIPEARQLYLPGFAVEVPGVFANFDSQESFTSEVGEFLERSGLTVVREPVTDAERDKAAGHMRGMGHRPPGAGRSKRRAASHV